MIFVDIIYTGHSKLSNTMYDGCCVVICNIHLDQYTYILKTFILALYHFKRLFTYCIHYKGMWRQSTSRTKQAPNHGLFLASFAENYTTDNTPEEVGWSKLRTLLRPVMDSTTEGTVSLWYNCSIHLYILKNIYRCMYNTRWKSMKVITDGSNDQILTFWSCFRNRNFKRPFGTSKNISSCSMIFAGLAAISEALFISRSISLTLAFISILPGILSSLHKHWYTERNIFTLINKTWYSPSAILKQMLIYGFPNFYTLHHTHSGLPMILMYIFLIKQWPHQTRFPLINFNGYEWTFLESTTLKSESSEHKDKNCE